MANKPFTDASIRGMKLTRKPSERYERFEPGGLGIRIGNRNRSFFYLYRFYKKPRRMTLGRYPGMSLADARVALAEAKRKVAHGEDPGARAVEQRRAERLAETVSELADLYIELHAKMKKKSWREDRRVLDKDVLPSIGYYKAKDVERRDIVRLLDGITARGSPVTANRTHSVVARMFRFAVSRDIVRTNPAREIERNKETSRDRVLTDDEIRRFWMKLDDAPMSEMARKALRFMLVTSARKGEVVTAEWVEIDDDHVWEIPAAKSKNGRPHRLPLTELACDLIGKNDDGLRWVFPSPHTRGASLSPKSIDNAFREALASLELVGVTPHDLRRTAASNIAALGFPRFVVARLLNHAQSDVTGAVYDKYEYLPEKATALEAWARRLQQIISDEPEDSKVVELVAHRK